VNVLLISEHPAHVATVEAALRIDGRVVRTEATVERALTVAREWRPVLMLLDLDVGLTAGGLAAFLRDPVVRDGVGVMVIAHRDQLALVGPGVAIDDLVVTPIDDQELRTRVGRALFERSGGADGSVLRFGSLVIDLERYTVTVDDEVVDLTYKEYELLRFLASNPGKPFTREALLNRVWGYDYYGGSRTVDVHVRRIRSKIERHETHIDTVRNVGYRFIDRARRGAAGGAE
jgi:DNA-binding response OmpR family regulator